jgi:hypothetical protein
MRAAVVPGVNRKRQRAKRAEADFLLAEAVRVGKLQGMTMEQVIGLVPGMRLS